MIKTAVKQILRDGKEYIRYLNYKNTLPKNPMHDDIYIVEFPKSGITWLQHILGNIELQLAGKKDEYITFYNHHKYLPDIHQVRGAKINRFLERTFIKSHSEYNPYYYFVIYLIRNPFDVMVSYYNFLLNHGQKLTFEKFVKSSRGIILWKRHINSWNYKKTDAQRIHFIKYENLVNNTQFEINSLYKNLGVTISNEIINTSIDNSSINNMSNLEDHYKKYNVNYTMSFVGKKNKLKKEELLTTEIKQYIYDICIDEIKQFYPDLLNE